VKLLQVSCYSKAVLSGLVIATGGLQESLKKASTSALVGYLENSTVDADCEGKSREYMLSCDLIWVLQHYRKCDRVITPTLKVTEVYPHCLMISYSAPSICVFVLLFI
jgi:hypothetical protein